MPRTLEVSGVFMRRRTPHGIRGSVIWHFTALAARIFKVEIGLPW